MVRFSDPHISFAERTDIPALETLLNSAYRGERSTRGWTSEAHLILGEVRVDTSMLEDAFSDADSVFLKYMNGPDEIAGCVNLSKHGSRIYLGMFSVSPELQGGGIGKAILKAAEEYALYKGCDSIYMTVISVRNELIGWYMRHGYRDTGERKAFTEDRRTGKHTRPLEFAVLEKTLTGSST